MRQSPRTSTLTSGRLWRLLIALVAVALLAGALSSFEAAWAQPRQNSLRQTINTPVPSPTRGPSATPTLSPAPGVTRLFLRTDGLYNGTADTWIDAYTSRVAKPLDGGLRVKGGEIQSTLIRFDLAGQLPADAVVQSAELLFYVEIPAFQVARPLDVAAFRVLRSWQPGNVSWDYVQVSAQTAWGAPGCNAVGVDRVEAADDVATFQYHSVYRGLDVSDSIRYGQQNPGANYGWLLKGVSGSTSTYTMASSRHSNVEWRPLLRIDYTADGTPGTPTTTPTVTVTPSGATPTPTAIPSPTVQSLSASADTYLDEWAPTANYGGLGYMYVRPSGVRRGLVQFDLSAILGSGGNGGQVTQVLSATLRLSTGSTAPSFPVSVGAYPMARCWDEATATWNQAATGQSWTTPGGDYTAPPLAVTTISAANQTYFWDVTGAVQSWAQGGMANCGFMLLGQPGTEAQLSLMSSEGPANQPRLIVHYLTAPPEPTATPTPVGKRILARAFRDTDRDGSRSSGEPWLSGVTIELAQSAQGAALARQVTDAQGQALFDGLSLSQYHLRAISPWGYWPSTDNVVRVALVLDVTEVSFGFSQGGAVALPLIRKR